MTKSMRLLPLLLAAFALLADTPGLRGVSYAEYHETAVHEAGHVIVAWFSVGKPVDVYIDGRAGLTDIDLREPVNDADLWNMTAVQRAGEQAVRMFIGTMPQGTSTDQMLFRITAGRILKARHAGRIMRPPWPVSQTLAARLTAGEILILATDRAAAVLAAHKREVRLIAAALERHQSLDNADLVRLLGPSRRP